MKIKLFIIMVFSLWFMSTKSNTNSIKTETTSYDNTKNLYKIKNIDYKNEKKIDYKVSNNNFTSNYICDGREYCSQMKSCEEATYFINHCPNTKMDGNNDGVPCERQWCNK